MKYFRFIHTLIAAVVMIAIVVFPTSHASASTTFTVTVVNEGNDANPGNGTCATVSGSCTLRAAIQEANALAGADTINFNLPGSGIHSISITSGPLPQITDTLTLDGTSQPNCTVPCIVLSGANLVGSNSGLILSSNDNIVKGFIITSWSFDGINIYGDGNIIQANDIGFWPGNPSSLPNAYGIEISGSNNLIGGSGASARNVISGNTYTGIAIARSGGTPSGNKIQGNYIGTNAGGTAALANGESGIIVYLTASNTLIGGGTAGVRNIISGNSWRGIDSGAPGTRVQGNYIGTDAAGTAAVPNAAGGLYIDGGVVVLGGGTASAGNVIAYNNGKGIAVVGASTRVNMRRNSFYSNTDIGIDLGGFGVTLNDPLDPDNGPNGYQNFPVITSATSSTHVIAVTFRSKANQAYKLDFYSSPAHTCDPSGYGEGKKWIGTASITTDGSGWWVNTVVSSYGFLAGDVITATATDGAGRTSEFSACRSAR
jgi:CSLREA domain-containing protein